MAELATIGGFEVGETIGEGGMGAVYRGRHLQTDVEVAIKVIKRRVDEEALRRFHHEVQAHAGLQHPGIVYLFEFGEIDEAPGVDSDGDLRAGDPFVAMELADRGTVRDAMPIGDWETVHYGLVQILDALAHGHARGVIHRDLKPANVLVFDAAGEAEPEWRIKLTDFGIAHAFDFEGDTSTERLESPVGTPHYMAPEQLRAEWREYGPWTDLYALGCITWELVCGRAPFTGDNFLSVAMQHQDAPRPELEPQFPVPDGLEGWIHRAMATDPERRFRRAADALWALPHKLDHTSSGVGGAGEREPQHRKATNRVDSRLRTATLTVPATLALDEIRGTVPVEGAPEGGEATSGEGDGSLPDDGAATRPPLPEDWRPERGESLPAPLVGAGLGLFGLREPPFVDRTGECGRMWEALRGVVEEGAVRTVFIAGEAGTGKSRLAEWMATRAHEVGAARVMRAVHGRGGESTGEGIGGMVRRLVRGEKLGRGKLYERLLETLPALDEQRIGRETDARAICELIYPTDEDQETVDGPRFRFASRSHKCALIARLLRRYGGDRPAFVWLDDAQWSDLAMDLVEHLTQSPLDQPPALLAVTVRSEALNEDERLRERVDSLTGDDGCTHIRLEPLETEDHRRFVHRMLPLATALADRITERTEGNPLFATQLLGHLVENGQLEVGPEGFEVAEGADLEVPDEIHELWMRRLSRVVAGLDDERPDTVWAALERAAALGREVEAVEWRALGDQIGLGRPDLVRDRLVEGGLADRTDDGWSFAHDLFVDALRRRASERGEWAIHNRRCAKLLEGVYPERPKQTAARRAHHWIAGGKPEAALAPLLEDYRRLRELGDRQGARETLERRGELLDQLGIPANDPRRTGNDVELACVDLQLGVSPAEVLEPLEDARVRAERIGDDRLVTRAATGISAVHQRTADLPRARESARHATRRARDSGNAKDLFRALKTWAWAELRSGNLEAAEKRTSEYRHRASEHNNRYERLYARRTLAVIAKSRGLDERAAELVRETLEEAREAGYRSLQAQCHNGLGEIARFSGRAAEARSHYRRNARISLELGDPRSVALSQLNLVQVELMDGRFEVAREEFEEAERRFEELSQKTGQVHLLRLIELTLAAGTGAWPTFDEHYAHYEEGWPEDARLIKDHPWLLEMAGDYAAEAGEPNRAERAWKVSRELWDRLDDAEAVERLDEKLAGGHS